MIFRKKKQSLIILDDYFPNLQTGFRIAEYNYYLKNVPASKVYSTSELFAQYFSDYKRIYPEFSKQVLRLESDTKLTAQLAYTVFINNVYNFLPLFEENKIPFVFTLYPGGGFYLDQADSDDKLRAVLSSAMFRRVITTQSITRDYLLQRSFCNEGKIEHIFGVVTDTEYYLNNHSAKKEFKKDKSTFDICFVANKYMKGGKNKGYDIFVSTAKILLKKSNRFKFHVVGGFDKNDIDVTSLKDSIRFYGPRGRDFFAKFYPKMDIILSPVVPFVWMPGIFDGFPTGCCTDAALCGTAVLTSDPLNLNQKFKDKEDIRIIPPQPAKIATIVFEYSNHLDELYNLSRAGQEKFALVYSIENQQQKRLKLLQEFL